MKVLVQRPCVKFKKPGLFEVGPSGTGGGRAVTTWGREQWPFAEECDASLTGDLAGMLRGPMIEAAHSAENPAEADVIEVNERRRSQRFHVVLPRGGR